MQHGERLHELNDEQRRALQEELKKDLWTLAKRAARAVGDAGYEHIHSPEGAHTKAFLEYANEQTGGLLTKVADLFSKPPPARK
jgi:hypothetical protein